MLSVILTAAVLFPDISDAQILGVLVGGSILGIVMTMAVRVYERAKGNMPAADDRIDPALPMQWRMPPLDQLQPARLTLMSRVWMGVLRAYLVIAAGMLLFKLFHLATSGAAV